MERLRETPPLIKELDAAGFAISIRRHQNNEALVAAMEDIIRSVPQGGNIQILTQETLQYSPSTIYNARMGEFRVLCAVSEAMESVHTYNVILVNPPTFASAQGVSQAKSA